ncbi:hypothetical protein GP486_007876 [Trichoglossum hirsutum]|uniref:Uncharacterized protein n=1 Tax=Trichoglossum hirsutum TaxID=265104 RepID=A0A9P8IJ60_9PEZI|nr:hypothetical protein GP486_007876 [Trichoglossum hirsutum]
MPRITRNTRPATRPTMAPNVAENKTAINNDGDGDRKPSPLTDVAPTTHSAPRKAPVKAAAATAAGEEENGCVKLSHTVCIHCVAARKAYEPACEVLAETPRHPRRTYLQAKDCHFHVERKLRYKHAIFCCHAEAVYWREETLKSNLLDWEKAWKRGLLKYMKLLARSQYAVLISEQKKFVKCPLDSDDEPLDEEWEDCVATPEPSEDEGGENDDVTAGSST